MPYDIAFRFQQALDPSAFATLPAALHALTTAIEDCRNAGLPHDGDPAVLLLARHLGTVAAGMGRPDGELRRACMDAIAELRREPALIALAHKGVAQADHAQKLFHADGRKAMRRLAEALGLSEDQYDLRPNKAGPAVSGEITLHGHEAYVQLSIGRMGPGNEVMFRRVTGREDYHGDRNHWASVQELVQPERFAERIRRELHLAAPAITPTRLAA
jgi:hypothetical protein